MVTKRTPLKAASLFVGSLCTVGTGAFELSMLGDAVKEGKPLLSARYRHERVDQDNALSDAIASTLRLRLGYKTDSTRVLSFLVEAENVTTLGSDRFNSTTNGNTSFSVVPDPEATEVNQVYIRLNLNNTTLQAGRQKIAFDNARFVSNIGFRQNEQSFDAVVIKNASFPGHRITYAYVDKVHRILGDDNPLGDFDMTSHLVNYNHKFLNDNRLSVYGYLLEFEDASLVGRSTKTFGARLTGSESLSGSQLQYSLEYADQSPFASGDSGNNATYASASLGLQFSNQWNTSVGVEYMQGDGNYAFQAPLGAGHAFAGFADLFAVATPPNGLIDRHVKLKVPVGSVDLYAAYHNLVSDHQSVDYGTEWDVVVSRDIGEYAKFGFMYSAYSADQFAVDTNKAWFWIEFNY